MFNRPQSETVGRPNFGDFYRKTFFDGLFFVASERFGCQYIALLTFICPWDTCRLIDSQAITVWIDQLVNGNEQAAEKLWQHVSLRLQEFARQKLDVRTRRHYDEYDVANSAFHSLCRGLTDGRIEAKNRGALWGLLAVIAARKISAKQRYLNRQKRGGGAVRGDSGFAEYGDAGINQIDGNHRTPDVLAEVAESCDQLLNALPDEKLKRIVLLKFQGATDGEVAVELQCTRRTIVRKLEKIRRIWLEFSQEELNDENK